MATKNLDLPLVVIVGPTASGKTALSIELAEKFGGEIICADSRTVYIGMDIGTAKPSKQEQARVPHWSVDLIEPNERFTAADFKGYATAKIIEIRRRGHLPILVGGTGLYVDAVLFDYQFGGPADLVIRQNLEQLTIDDLIEYCGKNNVKLPENSRNKRYLIRAIEQKSINTKRRMPPIENSIVVGIATDRSVLQDRITQRAEQLFADGVVEEATKLGEKYGWNSEAMTGNIYPVVRQIVKNELSIAAAINEFITLDQRLVKRQLTWLRRNPYVLWLTLKDARDQLVERLASL